jgi:ribosomal protein L37AE/L43A
MTRTIPEPKQPTCSDKCPFCKEENLTASDIFDDDIVSCKACGAHWQDSEWVTYRTEEETIEQVRLSKHFNKK